MSVHVFFSFSEGLAKPVTVPKGTLAAIRAHVVEVETTLGYKETQYKNNTPHWETTEPKEGVTDEVLCRVAGRHNAWVRRLYEDLVEWTQHPPKPPTEVLRTKVARSFWHALALIDVPIRRWTEEYYRDRMEHLYEVMRGRESEGVRLDTAKLTPKQAGAVVRLFEDYFDHGQASLEVPNGRDELRSSVDGGYVWCEKCGAVAEEDEELCRRRKCPLRAERADALDEGEARDG